MPDPGELSFPPSCRLRKRREFDLAWRHGRKIYTRYFILIALIKPEGPARLGLTVSRKVGDAVQRNRIKRLVREFFRTHQRQIRQVVDISFVARKPVGDLSSRQLWQELQAGLVELKAFSENA